MLSAFTLAALTATGTVRLWMVIVLAFTSGVLLSFDQPARAPRYCRCLRPAGRSDERHFSADAGLQCGFHRRPTVGRSSGGGGWIGGRFRLERMQLSGGDRRALVVAAGIDSVARRDRRAFANLVRGAGNAGGDSETTGCFGAVLVYAVLLFRGAFASASGPDFCHQRSARRGGGAGIFVRCVGHRHGGGISPGGLVRALPAKGRLLVSANAAWVMALWRSSRSAAVLPHPSRCYF